MKGGPGFGGGVGDGLRVQRLHHIELVKGYLVSCEVGGLRERFFLAHISLGSNKFAQRRRWFKCSNIVIKY